MLVDTPILTPAAGENTTTLFEIDYHGEPAFLAQTGQLYNEANILAFGKVYCFGPTFRAEKSKTRRHLQEFWMVEPEIAFCKLEELHGDGGAVRQLHRADRAARSSAANWRSSNATQPGWKRSSRPSRASATMKRWRRSTRLRRKA